jgi:hypothetical protein
VGAWREIFGRTVVKLDIEPPAAILLRLSAARTRRAFRRLLGMELSYPRELIVDDDLSFMTGRIGPWAASSRSGRRRRHRPAHPGC